VFLVCCSAGVLNSLGKAAVGERLERIRYKKDFENVLMQCQRIAEKFEGSEETLRYIRSVEESLKRIAVETN